MKIFYNKVSHLKTMAVSALLHAALFKALLCKMLVGSPPPSIHSHNRQTDRQTDTSHRAKHLLTCSNKWIQVAFHLSPDLFEEPIAFHIFPLFSCRELLYHSLLSVARHIPRNIKQQNN